MAVVVNGALVGVLVKDHQQERVQTNARDVYEALTRACVHAEEVTTSDVYRMYRRIRGQRSTISQRQVYNYLRGIEEREYIKSRFVSRGRHGATNMWRMLK